MLVQFLDFFFPERFSVCLFRVHQRRAARTGGSHRSGFRELLSLPSASSNGALAEIPRAAGSEPGLFLGEVRAMPQLESPVPHFLEFRGSDCLSRKEQQQLQNPGSGKEVGVAASPETRTRRAWRGLSLRGGGH